MANSRFMLAFRNNDATMLLLPYPNTLLNESHFRPEFRGFMNLIWHPSPSCLNG